jgi:hypothetical protein
MRSLYAEQDVGAASDVARKFRKLRDDTRDDAKIYFKVILPLTTKFVCSVKEFFEYYDALSYEEWCETLPDILEDIKTHKELAHTLLKMYKEIMVPLKKREDEAKIIMTNFKDLQINYEKFTKECQDKAKTKRNWAYALAFIPVVNLIATPLLRSFANEDTAKAIAKIQETKILGTAALAVAETLIPALSDFIESLSKAASFFKIMEIEIESFGKKGEAAMSKESRKKSHYRIMKNKVVTINPSCHAFFAALPAILTDFEAIPDDGTDQTYIEMWLEKKLAEIKEERESIRKVFWDVLKDVGGIRLNLIHLLSLKPAES